MTQTIDKLYAIISVDDFGKPYFTFIRDRLACDFGEVGLRTLKARMLYNERAEPNKPFQLIEFTSGDIIEKIIPKGDKC